MQQILYSSDVYNEISSEIFNGETVKYIRKYLYTVDGFDDGSPPVMQMLWIDKQCPETTKSSQPIRE